MRVMGVEKVLGEMGEGNAEAFFRRMGLKKENLLHAQVRCCDASSN
jgi:hypothetical protein